MSLKRPTKEERALLKQIEKEDNERKEESARQARAAAHRAAQKDTSLTKAMVMRLAGHFPAAEDVTRIEPNTEAVWTAVYRVSMSKRQTWEQIARRLKVLKDDDALIDAMGKRRGMQIIVKYDSKEMGQEQYLSLSHATRTEVSLGQAFGLAMKKAGNYNSSFVTDVYFYIR